ncbi:hypothetical protein [Corynebacterium aurimucosum]|uniref:hypothetical protein n=1 Tax=Corynebacterium aurimucosum TaxID=169292 RepID=UPI000C807F79|nr:hypothetical protein [Corynebacterium aurimucosum]PMC68171.1 hypothetical protein CJ201_11830 [Corynebacterium aurimucosum]
MTSSARASRTFRGAAIALALTVFPLAGVAANPVSAKGGLTGLGAAVAHAQDATIPVPAGQTTTVSLPVPVDVSVAADGWNVSASGGTATVTAPPAGGQITVPVTYQGVTMTIVLVADADVTAEELNDAAESVDPGRLGGGQPGPEGAENQRGTEEAGGNGDVNDDTSDGGAATGADSSSTGHAQPLRTGRGWEGVDDSHTSYVNLESTIEGQTIHAKLGLKQALDLYNRFKHLEDEGVTLRYLNAEGEFIEGVKRDIDKGSRTMTLTYPEGMEPDNPFIMQFVNNDTQSAELVVTLTDPTREHTTEVPPEQQLDGDSATTASEESDTDTGLGAGVVIAGIAGLGIIALIAGFALRRFRSHRK